MVTYFRSERFVVACEFLDKELKIFQIIYSKDGSIFISFPYHKFTGGIVSVITHYPETTEVDLTPGGKITSQKVKYSHHWDGQVHFSQDSKVFTLIRKKSVPIPQINGHFFTVQLWGLENYDSLDPIKDRGQGTSKRRVIRFNYGNVKPEVIKFVGRLYNRRDLSRRTGDTVQGPIIKGVTPEGKISIGFLIAPPDDFKGSNYGLYLISEDVPVKDHTGDDALTFIGGFDNLEIMNNPNMPAQMLGLMYSNNDNVDIKAKIGAIDFENS